MASADRDFVHLHVHTDYSLLDGACRIDRLMERTTALGMKSLALTDHGNLFGAIEFYNAAKKHGIKPLIGCEIYITENSRLEKIGRSEEGKGYYHMGLLARNLTGYQNLLKLVSDAHLKGFYYKPRADLETLAQYADGLIGFTGCLAAIIPQYLLRGRHAEAREMTARFIDIFGREFFFVEIQDHGIPEQRQIIPGLLKLAEEFKLKVLATNDVHYINAEDATPHDALLCIQTGSKLAEENRMKFSGHEFYLKSRQEMESVFGEHPEWLLDTHLVAEMCDLAIPFPKGSERYPRFTLPPEVTGKMDSSAYLRHLCVEGLRERYQLNHGEITSRPAVAALLDKLKVADGEKPTPPDYTGLSTDEEIVVRMAYELAIIEFTGFIDYFLVVWDFIAWSRKQDIPVGPGRGSGAGCIVAFLLGITNLDPIRFKLLFERFLNPERVSPPDFDIDFCMRRRGEVIDYVREKYGKDCVANIITYGTLGAKMVVRDVARVNDLPFADADRLAKMIPDELNITLDDAIAKSSELREEIGRNPVARKIIEAGKVLEGLVRNTGKHAAGIIITDQPLDEFVPLTMQENDVTVQFDMGAVTKLGLLKMDFLGLKTLTVISDALENVHRTANPDLDIEAVPLDDPATYQLLNSGRTVGVFQLESGGMQSACRQVGVSNIDDINAVLALYRPGPMAFIPDYARGKKDPSSVQYPHPLLEPVLRETHGIIVYQEQVMECAKIIAGYTLGGADMLRRAMGKKDAEAMDLERVKFVEGAARCHGIPEKKANEIFDLLNKFASYGFNKSHSAAYAVISYQTAYLKANYPVQFMAGVLSSELGNAEKVSHFIDECQAMGIEVLGPDVNESRETFTPIPAEKGSDNGVAIRFGMAAIKGVGDSASRKIIEERESGGPFQDFGDFVSRVDTKACNKRVMECLIRSGAFDFTGVNRGVLLANLDGMLSQASSLQRDREVGQGSLFDLMDTGPDENGGPQSAAAGGLNLEPAFVKEHAFSTPDMLKHEKELLGFYVSGHPMDVFDGLTEPINSCLEEELKELDDREAFRFCGVVSGITKKLSKRDNRPWAFFNLVTKKGSHQINMYADTYAECGHLLEEGKPFIIQGDMLNRGGDPRLVASGVSDLEAALPGLVKSVCWLLNPDADCDGFLQKLRETVDKAFGETQIRIAFPAGPGHVAVVDVARSLSWKIDPAKYRRLRRHPAVTGVEIDTAPMVVKEKSWKRGSKAAV